MARKSSFNDIPCPYCKEPVAAAATKCPHCHSQYTASEIDTRKKQMQHGLGVGCVSVAVILLLLGWCSSPDTPKVIPETPGATAKADAVGVYKQVMSTVAACDAASTAMANRLQSADPVSSYRAAEVAEMECLGVRTKIKEISVPESLGSAAHKRMSEALENCSNAYLARWSGTKAIKEFLDGDTSVSKLSDVRADADAVSSGAILCAAGLVGGAMAAGATTGDLGLEEKATP
jgi:hypothetical protein